MFGSGVTASRPASVAIATATVEDKYATPVKELWVERSKQPVLKLVLKKYPKWRYDPHWPDGPVDAIVIKEDGKDIRFLPVDNSYREFRDADGQDARADQNPLGDAE